MEHKHVAITDHKDNEYLMQTHENNAIRNWLCKRFGVLFFIGSTGLLLIGK
jgi:hypothetical protein